MVEATWLNPKSAMETYVGIIRSPQDAITLFEACRLGLLPRVCRRLSEKERQQIKSGSVFVWDEREAGMRRWTDGKSWSASRVSGSFLTYREMEGKRSGPNNPLNAPTRSGRTPEGSRGSDDGDQANNDESPDGYRYKPDGLMKQSFSITTSTGSHLHLISYFSRNPQAQAHLKQPTSDPALRQIKPAPGMYPESSVQDSHSMPPVTRSPMPVTGPPHQQPTGPGYANKTFYRPTPPAPYHSGPPPQYGPPQLNTPPQWGSRPPQGGPPPPPNSYGQAPGGYPPPVPPPPQGPPLPGYHPGQPRDYPYRPTELPPVPGYVHSPGFTAPRNTTPPSEPGRAQHGRTGSAGSYQQTYYPSPRSNYTNLTPQTSRSAHPSQSNSPSSTPPVSSLDPRPMIVPSPLPQPSPRNLHPEYATGSSRRSLSPHRTPPTSYPPPHGQQAVPQLPQINPPTSAPQQPNASTIPSIGALVNGADSYERDRRSRSNSRSPGGGQHARADEGQSPGGQWSQNKIDFGEDRRALNVLNKAFRT